MAKEIERKFLVTSDAWRERADEGSLFHQAYVVAMEDRSVRVRIFDRERAQLTMKIGKTPFLRDEFEYDIPLADGLELLNHAIGIIIEKTRYRIPLAGFVWEVDVYQGALAGLVVAEVELKSEHDEPLHPAWLGPELTGDSRYSNQALALYGLPD